MSLIKTPEEIERLRDGGAILAKILRKVADFAKPGVSTMDLEKLARAEIEQSGAQSAFEGYQMGDDYPPFPAVLCSSVDHEIVHGIPRGETVLREGQIIGLDLGIVYKGLYTDAAVTVGIGKISPEDATLIAKTREALGAGIAMVRAGNTLGDIGFAIQGVAKAAGLGIVRDLIGHGVGHELHEKPDVPNYGKPGTLEELRSGMVIAIEPMFTRGDARVRILKDGWTVVTADGSQAAHFEHSVAVTETGHIILTAQQP